MTGLLFTFLSATLISQSFMDAMSVVLIIFMITMRFANKTRFSPLNHPSTGLIEYLFFSGWLLVVGLGLWSSDGALGLISEWKWIFNLYFLYWFLAYFLENRSRSLYLRAQTQTDIKTTKTLLLPLKQIWPPITFWQPLHFVLVACFNYGAISYFTGIDLFKQQPLSHGHRFGGPFDDPMNFAHIYGMYCVFLTAFLFDPKSQRNSVASASIKSFFQDRSRLLLLLTIVVTAFSVYLTLTRGAWIGLFSGLMAVFFILSWRWGLASFAFGLLSALILYTASETFQSRINQTLNPSQSYDSERINLWRTNWEIFKDHPLLGIGYGDYGRYLPIYFEKLNIPADHFQSHAHNQYIHFLSNTGALGLLFYVIFIGCFLFFTYQGYKKTRDPILLGCLGAQIVFHVGSITECNFERAKVRLVYLFFCALAAAVISYHRKFEQQK